MTELSSTMRDRLTPLLERWRQERGPHSLEPLLTEILVQLELVWDEIYQPTEEEKVTEVVDKYAEELRQEKERLEGVYDEA